MTTLIITSLIVSAASYLLGSFPTAYLVVQQFAHKNVMKFGTGNVGTMNTHRATGSKWMTLIVFLGDHLKGFLAFMVGLYGSGFVSDNWESYLVFGVAFFFVILGHNYTVWLKFKGGKGLAAAAGFFIGLQPWLYAVWVITFFILVAVIKYMVVTQVLATIILIPFTWVYFPSLFWIILGPCILVIIKHAPRMILVMQGREPTFYFSEKQRESQKIDKQVE
jgi:glycerol-3-phosphate acyltransferase PlsY